MKHTTNLKEYAKKYVERHPVENWDDYMIQILYGYATTPLELLEKMGITSCVFNNAMQNMSSFNLTRNERCKMKKIEKQLEMDRIAEEKAFKREHDLALEKMREEV